MSDARSEEVTVSESGVSVTREFVPDEFPVPTVRFTIRSTETETDTDEDGDAEGGESPTDPSTDPVSVDVDDEREDVAAPTGEAESDDDGTVDDGTTADDQTASVDGETTGDEFGEVEEVQQWRSQLGRTFVDEQEDDLDDGAEQADDGD